MSRTRQFGMAAATFSVALGIGFVMQNGDVLASRFGNGEAPVQPAPFTDAAQEAVDPTLQSALDAPASADGNVTAIPVAQSGVMVGTAPEIIKPEPVSSAAVILPDTAKMPIAQEAPIQLAALDTEAVPIIGADVTTSVAIDCVPSMVAIAGVAASVDLAIVANCHVDSPFTIHHQGMMFTAMTNDVGEANITVPALAEVAVLIAAFDDGDGAVATAVVPDFTSYDRAVLQWQGESAVMLSAYEGDAAFGDENHISADNPGNIERLEAAEGGYLVRLGDGSVGDALVAEVYTFPTGMMNTNLNVMLVAEAEITAGNCGQELKAHSIQVSPTGEAAALDLSMVMPECDAVGDFLILQNMFEDLTLASK